MVKTKEEVIHLAMVILLFAFAIITLLLAIAFAEVRLHVLSVPLLLFSLFTAYIAYRFARNKGYIIGLMKGAISVLVLLLLAAQMLAPLAYGYEERPCPEFESVTCRWIRFIDIGSVALFVLIMAFLTLLASVSVFTAQPTGFGVLLEIASAGLARTVGGIFIIGLLLIAIGAAMLWGISKVCTYKTYRSEKYLCFVDDPINTLKDATLGGRILYRIAKPLFESIVNMLTSGGQG